MSNDTIMEAALSTLNDINDFLDNLEVYDTKSLVDFVERTLNYKCRRGGMKEATYRRFLINKIRKETYRSSISQQQLVERGNRCGSSSSKRTAKNSITDKYFAAQ